MKRAIGLFFGTLLTITPWLAAAESGSSDSTELVVHVLNRLAYGPRPGDIESVQGLGIDRYIESQLAPSGDSLPPSLTIRLQSLPVVRQSAGETLAQFLGNRQLAAQGDEEARQRQREIVRTIVEQTSEARLLRAVHSPRQLEEVMVDFWFNHFNVFIGKGLDAALVAAYERDAIRPFVFGNFRALLGATARHPAMLFYLDNWLSSSSGYQPALSRRARQAGKKALAGGLNENYARELMELHTLGVDGGYTQHDVTELARMLTGWSFTPQRLARDNVAFQFDAQRHDSGGKQWLGQDIAQGGELEGEHALDILAMHPSTARHIGFALAQYFVQDAPPPALVERLAKRYLDTNGDIRSVLRVLFSSQEFRSPSAIGAKFKTPYQFVVSAVRAASVPTENVRPELNVLRQLGMPLYGCQTPDGYKNTEAAWLNPDALSRRINFATALGTGKLRIGARDGDAGNALPAYEVDSGGLLTTLGPSIGAATRKALAGQPPRLQAAMILGSPDFMRH
jgi:uncharacterized protein (DUF1800 family)